MALSPSAPTTSPLPRQLLRYVSSHLVAALNRAAPTISLPSAPRGADAAAAPSRGAPSPKGRPGAPRPGSGGHVHHAAPVMATSGMVMRGPPTPPGLPAKGRSGKTHVAPVTVTATAADVVMGGPAPSAGLPEQGSGGKVDAALAAAASLALQRPTPPRTPKEGSGGGGGIIHAAVAAADS